MDGERYRVTHHLTRYQSLTDITFASKYMVLAMDRDIWISMVCCDLVDIIKILLLTLYMSSTCYCIQ